MIYYSNSNLTYTSNPKSTRINNMNINFGRKNSHDVSSKYFVNNFIDELKFQQSSMSLAANLIRKSNQVYGGSRIMNRSSADLFSAMKNTPSNINHSTVNLSSSSSHNPFVVVNSKNHAKRHARNKMILHFNNRGTQETPKTALNHASVFLNKNRNFENQDDVPDEDVDEKSLSRVSDTIISRGSVTNNLNRSMESPFASKLGKRK